MPRSPSAASDCVEGPVGRRVGAALERLRHQPVVGGLLDEVLHPPGEHPLVGRAEVVLVQLPPGGADRHVPPLEVALETTSARRSRSSGAAPRSTNAWLTCPRPDREEQVPVHGGIGQEGVVDDVDGVGDDLAPQRGSQPIADAHARLPPQPPYARSSRLPRELVVRLRGASVRRRRPSSIRLMSSMRRMSGPARAAMVCSISSRVPPQRAFTTMPGAREGGADPSREVIGVGSEARARRRSRSP